MILLIWLTGAVITVSVLACLDLAYASHSDWDLQTAMHDLGPVGGTLAWLLLTSILCAFAWWIILPGRLLQEWRG